MNFRLNCIEYKNSIRHILFVNVMYLHINNYVRIKGTQTNFAEDPIIGLILNCNKTKDMHCLFSQLSGHNGG